MCQLQMSIVDTSKWIINANSLYKVNWEQVSIKIKKKINLEVTHS